MKILLATNNSHKVEKLAWIVDGYFERIETPQSIGLAFEPAETGQTFEQNAVLKALEYSRHYDGSVIATDGGILIPALGKDWDGIRTKRFAGEGATDQQRIQALLELMKDKKGEERTMIWHEAIALAKNGRLLFSTEVEGVKGVLQEQYNPKHYKPGIWVCSVWYFPERGKNFFEMTEHEQEYVEQSWHRLRQRTREFLGLSVGVPD